MFCSTELSFNGGGRKDELDPRSKHFVRKQSEQYQNFMFTFGSFYGMFLEIGSVPDSNP
jgi:hypothetical protein